jgi:hypothetical protein
MSTKEFIKGFNQPIILGESGTARLRKGSQFGEILEEFDVKSDKVQITNNGLVLLPETQLPYETEIFLTMDDGFVIAKRSGERCTFLNEKSDTTFSIITEDPIGNSWDGGTIISKVGGRYLIVSPKEAELNLFWEEREKAIAHTKKITGTKGWFIPSSSLLMNKELNVRDLWFHNEDGSDFWTSDEFSINMTDLILASINKNTLNKVRTFKFVGV